jgi:hypothetical protein
MGDMSSRVASFYGNVSDGHLVVFSESGV